MFLRSIGAKNFHRRMRSKLTAWYIMHMGGGGIKRREEGIKLKTGGDGVRKRREGINWTRGRCWEDGGGWIEDDMGGGWLLVRFIPSAWLWDIRGRGGDGGFQAGSSVAQVCFMYFVLLWVLKLWSFLQKYNGSRDLDGGVLLIYVMHWFLGLTY